MRMETRSIYHAVKDNSHGTPDWSAIEDAVIDLMDNGFRPRFHRVFSKGVLIGSQSLPGHQARGLFNEILERNG